MIGVHKGSAPGPLVIVTGGVHGNEPAGIHAVRRVLERLAARSIPLRGTLMGVAGNRAGLGERMRYLDRDLNRRWVLPDMVALLARDPAGDSPEDREQRELLHLFAPLCAQAKAPIVFLDLHSTSGDGAPFVCMADVLRNRTIAFALGIPVVLGLEEVIDGSMIGFFTDLGHIGVAVEGGQHDDPRSVDCHEAAIWIALVAAEALDEADVPDLARQRSLLAEATRGLPRVLEIRHRHVVTDDDDFVMRPGFTNFQPVRAAQPVADDRRGEVRTPEAGIMMLPRYQGQGEDGYFLARPVSRLWLTVSAGLRLARADRLVTMLPGVQRDPSRGDHMLVERDRPRAIDVFHLLGFRHQRAHGGERYEFSRRRPDFATLEHLPASVRALIERLVTASAG
ncbi:MAG: succinylglutamate desuccinylase/aspartoacylase family protein [Nannocystaceae bacterium]